MLFRGAPQANVCTNFDWLPWPGTVVEATEKLILGHNPAWPASGGNGIHDKEFADLTGAGFHALQSFSYDEDVPYTHEVGVGASRRVRGLRRAFHPRMWSDLM